MPEEEDLKEGRLRVVRQDLEKDTATDGTAGATASENEEGAAAGDGGLKKEKSEDTERDPEYVEEDLGERMD